MKKLSFVLATVLMATMIFSGCGKTSENATSETANDTTTAAEETGDGSTEEVTKSAALLMPSTANGFMAMLADLYKEKFEAAGYEFELGIADGDSKKQIDQIENYITLGVDTLVVMAVEPSSLYDVLSKAMEAGVHVINFTTDPKVGDVYVGADNMIVGEAVAEIASEWIDATFPDAAAGSIKVAVMEFKDTPEAAERTTGLYYIEEINDKVTIQKSLQVANTTKDAQTAAENLFLTDPDINVVLTYNSAMALGVNTYVMTPGSAIKDKSIFGVFGADQDAEVLSNILASMNDESVLRGATQIGGDINETVENVVQYSEQLINGEETIERDVAPINRITTENVEELMAQ